MGIGERLKMARQMAGMSQRDLAEAAGVSAMAISKYERDLMTPPKATRPLQAALSAVPGGVQVVQLPGSGHAMMSEAPEALGQALRTFLATR